MISQSLIQQRLQNPQDLEYFRRKIIEAMEEFSFKKVGVIEKFADCGFSIMQNRPYYDRERFVRNLNALIPALDFAQKDDKLFIVAAFLKWSDDQRHGNIWDACHSILSENFGWTHLTAYRISYILKVSYFLTEFSFNASPIDPQNRMRDFIFSSLIYKNSVDFIDDDQNLFQEHKKLSLREFMYQRATFLSNILSRGSSKGIFTSERMETKYGAEVRRHIAAYIQNCADAGILTHSPLVMDAVKNQNYELVTKKIGFNYLTS